MNDADLGWYFRSRGRVLGPFQLAQLEVLKNQGRVAKFDELSRDRRNWIPAGSLPELFPPPAPRQETTGSPGASGQPGGHGDDPVADDAAVWFYVSESGQTGPVSLSEMIRLSRAGVLRAETFVWNSGMTDWLPARDVPALGSAATSAVPTPVAAKGQGFNITAIAGFVLGVTGLLSGAMAFLTSAFLLEARQNRDFLLVIFTGLLMIWGLSSLLAVILGPIGMVRANRDGGARRGFSLGLAGMVLGIVGLLGLLILVFMAALGRMSSDGPGRGAAAVLSRVD